MSRLKQWHDVEVWPEAQSVPGILVFEFRGPLVFASAEWFEEEVERKRLQADIRVKFVILCIWVMPMCIFLFLFGGCAATTSLTLASSIGRGEIKLSSMFQLIELIGNLFCQDWPHFCLGMGAVPTIDYSALNMLRSILSEWHGKGLRCFVAEANSAVLELLREELGHELLEQLLGCNGET